MEMRDVSKADKRINKKKGQASMETITLLGFIILFSIPLLALITTLNTEDSAILQAKASTRLLADTANSVYMQGQNAQKVVSIAFPPGLTNVTVIEAERGIMFSLETQAGPIDIVARSIAPLDETSNITGSGGLNPGSQKVIIKYEGNQITINAIE